MGKYDPLRTFLQGQRQGRVPMKFDELESILGFKLPASKQYPAWWSNSPSNNPMTKVWLQAGYKTEQVDTAGERLVFSRAMSSSGAAIEGGRPGRFPGFGALAGTVRVAAGVDLTDPTGEIWDAASE